MLSVLMLKDDHGDQGLPSTPPQRQSGPRRYIVTPSGDTLTPQRDNATFLLKRTTPMTPILRRAPGEHPGLMTDMYHPDSAYVSWVSGRNGQTTFDLYTRSAPFGGAYLLVAGLEAALEFVQAFRYSEEELAFLARIRDYEPAFLDELAQICASPAISSRCRRAPSPSPTSRCCASRRRSARRS